MKFLESVGAANASLAGVAAAILVPLALGVSPVYAVLVGLSVSGFGILPGFIAMITNPIVNPVNKVIIAAIWCIIVSVLSGFIGYSIFKNYKIVTADEIRGNTIRTDDDRNAI